MGSSEGRPALVVLRPGPLDLIQDEGRIGLQRFGVPTSGALDDDAYRVALALAGSDPAAPVIEFLHASGAYELVGDVEVTFAVAGAPGPVFLNDRVLATNRSFRLAPGDRLRAGPRSQGQRGYIACSQGFCVRRVLGSASTHPRGGFGGLDGRALASGDILPIAAARETPRERIFPDSAWPPERARPARCDGAVVVRAVAGPQDDHFPARMLARFEASTYRVSKNADRMGYQLEGERLEHTQGFNIVSDAIAVGSVQVPGNGRPIVLMADRQTTGGFPKIATVISVDLPLLAQLGPGDALRFRLVSREEAQEALRQRALWRRGIAGALRPAVRSPSEMSSEYLLSRNLVTAYVEET